MLLALALALALEPLHWARGDAIVACAAGIAGGGFQQVASPAAAPSRNMELPLAAEPSDSGRRGVMGDQLAVHGAVVEVERRRERSVATLRRSSQGPEPMNGQTGLAE
ncbi:hypothetical protein B5807_11564 [Epicoccum nigrum]|uniref:Uncharacterized protein n=1 Tax=Epicoccum nigrum TaxID=105696 RepID=A0A1Y2LIC9_EPING|nr:hypothetical protein B5807_11564 [Epicoccum nigrum]